MKRSIFLFSTLILASCGGGGGHSDSAKTDPNQEFSLQMIASVQPGLVYSTKLTGKDSDGYNYTGTYSITNRSPAMFGGVMATPRDASVSLTTGGDTQTISATFQLDSGGDTLSYAQADGHTCTAVSPNALPSSVKIGDVGNLSTMQCSDNTTEETSWKVLEAGGGKANLVETDTTKDQSGAVTDTDTTTYTINPAGAILAFKEAVVWTDGYTLTFQSQQ